MTSVLLIVLLLFVIFSFFGGKRMFAEKWVIGRKIFWLFGAYGFVLLVSTVHYTFFLPDAISSEQQITSEEVQTAYSELQRQAETGNFEEMEEDYRRNDWTMEPAADKLYIENHRNDLSVYYLQGDYSEVEAAYYQSPSAVNGSAVTSGYQPTIELNNNILSIEEDAQLMEDKKYAGYKKEFPFLQFENTEEHPSDVQLGFGTIVLKIPEQIDIRAQGARAAGIEE
ncbi:hypothetical protein [Salibacterium aidingense]|uniref:hypothetical protein n=1 Tax=Salibacterium aidingense TaxID=384933 RepID=UPI000419D496|nr:hypothetical protein [Salibacterium aidingense]